ncbi:Non-heme chloroperoxidase [Thermoflexales bacterium]|nr:Non-heme chloroperoxidase [Thermoflexales bacterium]
MSSVKIHRNLVTVNGIDLFYLDTRTPGDTIVCLHGRWGRGETWVDLMHHYGEKYRIIAPDQRGHGLSGRPVSKYTADEMAADIIALLNHLDLESIILVGHSMGAYIAGYLTTNYPGRVKALALLDKSAAGPAQGSTLPVEEIAPIDPISKDWPLPFSSLTEARACIRNAMESELSYQYFMNSLIEELDGYHMMYSAQAMAANIAYYQDWFERLPQIKCPVLLIKASGQEAVPDVDFNRMQSLLTDCMALEMSDPDHNVHLANPQEFYGYFDQFLSKVVIAGT